jgi:hypothetical protein
MVGGKDKRDTFNAPAMLLACLKSYAGSLTQGIPIHTTTDGGEADGSYAILVVSGELQRAPANVN